MMTTAVTRPPKRPRQAPDAGLMEADAYAGFTKLYEANRKTGPIMTGLCW
jgi:hypothetical protein